MPENQLPACDRPDSGSSGLSTSSSNFFRAPNIDQAALFTPSLSSLDSDEQIIQEYENALPQIIHYEPIELPKEQTLEEILQQAAGTTELDNVKALKLSVIAASLSLQLIATHCPLLSDLDLTGSALCSIRDLGCMLSCMTHLNVSRCGLNSLDGTNGIYTVTHLIADHNAIEYIDTCTNLDDLEELSVIGNQISDLGRVGLLRLCSKLRSLNVRDNPITDIPGYEDRIRTMIPHLVILDGRRLREDIPQEHNPEESFTSSSDTSSYSSLEKSLGSSTSSKENNEQPLPNTVSGSIRSVPSNSIRPATADNIERESHRINRPLSGSLMKLQQRLVRSVWTPAPSLPNPQMSIYTSLLDKEFPERLPQMHVELEMGVLDRATDSARLFERTELDSLLAMANKWRKGHRRVKNQIRRAERTRSDHVMATVP